MPTPRRSGAPLVPLTLVTPAAYGLNKQSETSVLGPEWATIATNAVFDTAGRLSARQGFTALTSSSVSVNVVRQVHEQVTGTGGSTIITACDSKLFSGTTTLTNITGTATVTVGDNWQFVNNSNTCWGFQQGEQPIWRTSGNFTDISPASGTSPQGNCAVVHSGRIWAADSDYQTIKYCALLDDTKWATADGAGSIDMTSVWPQGTDQIIALAMYNGQMVVFGKNRIVLFGDGAGSALGIDPANIYVTDTIVGVGCIARDSVQQIEGGDILFLSAQGVQSLSRLIQEKSNPINNVSKNVRDYLNGLVGAETGSNIKSAYSPENAFYLLCIPAVNTVFCFNTNERLPDGSFAVTEWNLDVTACCRAQDGTLYLALDSVGGKIGYYNGYTDNGTTYNFDYASAWLDVGQDASQYIKILKTYSAVLYTASSSSVLLKWDLDFQGDFTSRTLSLSAPGTSEWGIMEWGIGEWSGGLALRTMTAPASGSGQYVRIGLQSGVSGQLSIQQLKLLAKLGRLVK